MCIIPYATQLGEISFCAYNTGIGWRKIIEHMYKKATVAEWNKKHGKHGVYAGGHEVPLESFDHNLVLNPVGRRPSSRAVVRNRKPRPKKNELRGRKPAKLRR